MKALILGLFSLSLVACGGSGGAGLLNGPSDGDAGSASSSSNVANVGGAWVGKFVSETGAIGLSHWTLTQQGTTVSGPVDFVDSACFASAQVAAAVHADAIAGKVTAGSLLVQFDGTVTATAISGTYDVVRAGACTGDKGTFTFTRQ